MKAINYGEITAQRAEVIYKKTGRDKEHCLKMSEAIQAMLKKMHTMGVRFAFIDTDDREYLTWGILNRDFIRRSIPGYRSATRAHIKTIRYFDINICQMDEIPVENITEIYL